MRYGQLLSLPAATHSDEELARVSNVTACSELLSRVASTSTYPVRKSFFVSIFAILLFDCAINPLER